MYQGIIHMMLVEASGLRVKRDDGSMIVAIPAPDPVLKQLLAAEDPNEMLVLIGMGAV